MTPNPGKPINPTFRFILTAESFRTFSWAERFAILFGAGLVEHVGIATAHSPGNWAPRFESRVSDKTSIDAHVSDMKRESHHMLVPKGGK